MVRRSHAAAVQLGLSGLAVGPPSDRLSGRFAGIVRILSCWRGVVGTEGDDGDTRGDTTMGRTITHKGITTLIAVCAIAALTPAAPAAAAQVPATAIVLERAGGFAGTRDSFVVDRSTVGGRRPLRMAGSPEFRWLRSSYQPENPCCDRYSYRVTVTYPGGHHKTVSTVQGATAPHILWDVIAQVERVGIRPLSPAPAAALRTA
jgi:hypothetical protein